MTDTGQPAERPRAAAKRVAATKATKATKATARTAPAKRVAKKAAPAKRAPRAAAAQAAPAQTRRTRRSPARTAAESADVSEDFFDDSDDVPGDDTSNGDALTDGQSAAGTPHRPSRRHLIVDAAIRVFARKGFSEASIQEIADDAGVVATAVYYHFAGKEELFEAALTRGLDASDAVIAAARPDEAPADAAIFRNVIRASWEWAEAHPDMARLLFLHMPGGATPGARALARDYLDRHARRAYDYFDTTSIPPNRRRAAAEYAARTLTVRTVMGLTLSVHSLQMEGGPLATVSSAKMVDATARLCERLFHGA